MELYQFFWGALAWMGMVAIVWPVNAVLAGVAFKIQSGAKPLDMEMDELRYRSLLASGLIALLTIALIFLDYLFLDLTEFPAGPIHLVVFMAYVPAAAWLMVFAFSYSELTEGLSTFIIYVGLPIVVMLLVHLVIGSNPLLDYIYTWLKAPTA